MHLIQRINSTEFWSKRELTIYRIWLGFDHIADDQKSDMQCRGGDRDAVSQWSR